MTRTATRTFHTSHRGSKKKNPNASKENGLVAIGQKLNKNIRKEDPEYQYFERMLSAAWPYAEVFKFMSVRMKPGENIKAHKHAHPAVLFYPEIAEPVIITPQPGTMLFLPIGTVHEVPPVKRHRKSIAMLMEK